MKGNISISRTSNNTNDPKTIHVVIEDEISRVQFFEGWMTPEDFGNCISGLSMVDIDFRVGNTDLIGKKREVKTEIVELPEGVELLDEFDPKAVLAPYEVDGWTGHGRDLRNHHNRVTGRNAYRVTFIRFVDAEPKEGEA